MTKDATTELGLIRLKWNADSNCAPYQLSEY